MRWIHAVLGLALIAPSAFASDGVLEINQTCAVGGGCFAGDAAGFPVTIASTGSYRLTSNLTVPDENTGAIVVSASFVSIDLNKFTIAGPTNCTGAPRVCTPASGSGVGIGIDDVAIVGTAVRNGSITGMGFRGASLGAFAVATDLRVSSSRGQAIVASAGALVADDVVTRNGSPALSVDDGSIVADNDVSSGGGGAISADNGVLVTGNALYRNEGDGILSGLGAIVSGNGAQLCGDDGIVATGASLVQRNVMRQNTGVGLVNIVNLTPSAYRLNSITENLADTVTGTWVDAGGNSCDNAASCP